jgi:peptidoglycan/LPS O-acetylase OafA/YrhL
VRRRWRRRLAGQLPFLAVLALLAAAAIYLAFWPGHWRRGTGVIAGAMLLGALLRLLLPNARAGLLRVRARWLDVAWYGGLGVVLLGVAIRLK